MSRADPKSVNVPSEEPGSHSSPLSYHLKPGESISGRCGPPYIVMDYAPGRSLADLLIREGSLDTAGWPDIMTPVADALEHVHSKGIVHRDLKPSNIMLTGSVARTLTKEPAKPKQTLVENAEISEAGIQKFVRERPAVKGLASFRKGDKSLFDAN